MRNFLLYLFYRSEQIKNRYLALQGESIVAFFPAINIASLLIVIMKLLLLSGIIDEEVITTPICIQLTGVFCILLIILVPIYMYVNRKKFRKIISTFEQETVPERKKNGRKIMRYIFISFIAIVVAFLL
jgi:hypothetical protein